MKILLGRKKGMTQLFQEDGKALPVTVVDVSENIVAKKLKSADKETHIVLGKDKVKKPNKADKGNFKEIDFVPNYRKTFKLDNDTQSLNVGDKLEASLFNVGDKVNVVSITKGKGFQGVVKRHGFKGGPKTHGQSDRQRAPGSIGNRTIPGRVYKGKRMAGHMGQVRQTTLNLKVVSVDVENKLITLSGAIPGGYNNYLVIKSI